MIYQNPFGSLNPTMRVGAQIAETLRVNRGLSKEAAKAEALALLERVGIEDPERRSRAYPHELSGGMCQRVMIAIATASSPRLMLADEPTTALDVTTQAQILKLLGQMRAEEGMAMLLVSHDFGVIAQACDRVAVMYGGHIVETGPVETIYHEPEHPYTRALLNSVPELDSAGNVQRRAALRRAPAGARRRDPRLRLRAALRARAAGVRERLDEAGAGRHRPRDAPARCVPTPRPERESARPRGWKRERRRSPPRPTRRRRLLEVESLVKEFGLRRGLAELHRPHRGRPAPGRRRRQLHGSTAGRSSASPAARARARRRWPAA